MSFPSLESVTTTLPSSAPVARKGVGYRDQCSVSDCCWGGGKLDWLLLPEVPAVCRGSNVKKGSR